MFYLVTVLTRGKKMTTYIYSKWKNSPAGCPDEFYSEIDETRHETRKVEVLKVGN